LFRQMLATVNKEIVSFLFRGGIASQQEPEEMQEARPQPRPICVKCARQNPELVRESGMPMMDDTRELQNLCRLGLSKK